MAVDLVLGVDGGQSGTAVAIADASGVVRGVGFAGPVRHPGADGAAAANAAAVSTAVTSAFDRAGLRLGTPIVSARIGTAAAIDELRELVDELVRPQRVVSDTDAATILASAGVSAGVGVAAGTGTVAVVHDGSRELFHGGWGWLLGDEGSAYWIGAEAIRLAVRGHDGRGPATSLERPLLEMLGAPDLYELFDRVHRGEVGRPAIARLAKLVAEHAATDAPARGLVDRAGEELLAAALAAHAALPTAPRVLVTAGGVLAPTGPVHAALLRHAERRAPDFEIRPAALAPAVAACLLAIGEVSDETYRAAVSSSAAIMPDTRKDRR